MSRTQFQFSTDVNKPYCCLNIESRQCYSNNNISWLDIFWVEFHNLNCSKTNYTKHQGTWRRVSFKVYLIKLWNNMSGTHDYDFQPSLIDPVDIAITKSKPTLILNTKAYTICPIGQFITRQLHRFICLWHSFFKTLNTTNENLHKFLHST